MSVSPLFIKEFEMKRAVFVILLLFASCGLYAGGYGYSPTYYYTLSVGTITSSGAITGSNFVSTVAAGTAPFASTSTTLCTNLNADSLDGHDQSYFLNCEVDGVIGNEVTTATDTTLTRSGSGTTEAPYTLGLTLSNPNTWTGAQSVDTGSNGAAIFSTWSSMVTGLALVNDTASTSGATVQDSDALTIEAHAWDTAPGQDDKWQWKIYADSTSGTTSTNTLEFVSMKSPNGVDAAPVRAMYLTSSGGMVLADNLSTGYIAAVTDGIKIGGAGATSNIRYYSANATGIIQCSGSVAGTYVAGLDLGATDGVVKVTDGNTGYGQLETGGFILDRTITPALTTGDQTINKVAGTVNIAALGTTVTVTNSLVTATSIVLCTLRTADATAWIKNVVPGAGSFIINLGAGATAEVSIGFVVTN